MARRLTITLLALVPILVWQSGSCADQIPLLVKALGDTNIRRGASIALTKLGAPAVPALRKSLASEKPDVRVWSAFTLGEIGSAAEPAVGDLAKAFADSDDSLRAAAAQALGKIGAPAGVPVLVKALDDQNNRVRQRSAVALGQIGPESHAATAKLIAALSDHQLRRFARESLIQIGASTTDSLVDSLDDDNIRFDVSVILRKVDPAKAKQLGLEKPTAKDLPSLRTVFFDASRQPEEILTTARSLAALGDEGFVVLIGAFEQQRIARAAASAFAKAGPPAVPMLIEVLAHKQPKVRATAADALAHMGPAAGDAATDLIRLLKDQDRDVRYRVVRALHEFGPKAKLAVPALAEVILNERELEPTRQWSIKTLVMTLPKTHDAVVKALLEASKEETNYGVRQLARQHLRKIDPKAAEAAGIK